jgi:hypothetical protein
MLGVTGFEPWQESGMLTPRRRALFEASLSALLLPSDSPRPWAPLDTGTKREPKNVTDNNLPPEPGLRPEAEQG